jgi:paraquat-inducible protein B
VAQRASPTLIGAFTLGALLLAVAGVLLLGSGDLFRTKYPFVSYFEDSVNGLHEGAPVKFKGVEIGTVDQIRLPLGPDNPPVMVFFSLDAEEIAASQDQELSQEELDHAIAAGLRAQLEQESFLTGLLYLSLEFAPESEVKLHEPIPGIPELPTIQTSFARIAEQIGGIVDKLEQVDLAALVEELGSTVQSVGDLVRSEEIRTVLTSFDLSLAEFREIAAEVRHKFVPLVDSLEATSTSVRDLGGELSAGVGEARETLVAIRDLTTSLDQSSRDLARAVETVLQTARSVIDPDSPPVARLEEALNELSATARAARAVLEILEREPAALIRGLGEPE